jgi:trehalose-6-phosphate synthase
MLAGAVPHPDGLAVEGRIVAVGAHPVGVDMDEILEVGRTAELPDRFRDLGASGHPLVVGLERSDFTKGIPERLHAIARAYDRGQRFTYLGVAAPTREGVSAYARLEDTIAGAAREAGEAAERVGATFLHLHESIPWDGVIALQREADVVFTSSLADGMNLVPLQAAVAQSFKPLDRRAVVITGRDAGVAVAFSGFEEDGLVSVDPCDGESMVTTLTEALAGRPARVSDHLVDEIRKHDAVAWATQFLAHLEAAPC